MKLRENWPTIVVSFVKAHEWIAVLIAIAVAYGLAMLGDLWFDRIGWWAGLGLGFAGLFLIRWWAQRPSNDIERARRRVVWRAQNKEYLFDFSIQVPPTVFGWFCFAVIALTPPAVTMLAVRIAMLLPGPWRGGDRDEAGEDES